MAANSSSNAGIFLPRTLLPLAGLLLLTALQEPLAQAAQEEAGALAAAEPLAAVDVFTVRPLRIAPAVLMPNARVPAAPPPLERDALLAWLQRHGGHLRKSEPAVGEGVEQAAAEPVLDTLVLGPATPSIAERAHLVLTRPSSVHPETTVEFAADTPGMASVRLKLPAGEIRLLDFAVSAMGPGVYAIAADSSRREFDDARGELRHVLIGIKAEADGWTSVRLQRSGAGYHLHSVTITQAL